MSKDDERHTMICKFLGAMPTSYPVQISATVDGYTITNLEDNSTTEVIPIRAERYEVTKVRDDHFVGRSLETNETEWFPLEDVPAHIDIMALDVNYFTYHVQYEISAVGKRRVAWLEFDELTSDRGAGS